MAPLTRIPLEGGGSVLVEQTVSLGDGPVKAGRIGDAVHDVPVTLQRALEPVAQAAQAALDQLRKARPDEITVEFGVDLAFEAGAVITRSQAGCHLNVTVSWKSDGSGQQHADERTAALR
ncbi:CU044_2847 family protein [Streptomyces sp. NPDC013178]|uniref:CU044_2847 family protein n=1 Tax=unclassified Streptomyces TaxID=2593676 RepID=UPI0033DE0F7D